MVRPEGLVPSDAGGYKVSVHWREYPVRIHRVGLNWSGQSLVMDVPAGGLGGRSLFAGDEIAFGINQRMVVKIQA